MRVKVLYFAGARELTSKGSETVVIDDGGSVADLEAALVRLHPDLRKLEHSARFSVNMEVAGEEVLLRDGDEVGVLPPVAGG